MADFTYTQGRPDFSKLEEDVLSFWDETHAFSKSVEQRSTDNAYVFYDGPPFANGLPHYGHLLGSTCKDVIPRYQTMKGKRVERVWGWDCHGVPVENGIEKELGIKGGKKGIEALGIATFNQACRSSIMMYDEQWKKTIKRLGRWVDFDNNYKTMDASYMESVWWGFKQLFDKGLIYQGHKVILYCPRCSTPLSNFEIAMDNSYKMVEDYSLYVKFRVKEVSQPEYFVAWTTTPWTLPGNVALAVQANAEYALVEHILPDNAKEFFWFAKDRLSEMTKHLSIQKAEVVKTVLGKELDGMEYEPLYSYMPLHDKKAHYMTTADFVSLEDGSGIVHTAAIFGEDDYALAQEKDLPCVPTLDDQGKFLPFVTPLSGVFYKKAEEWVVNDLSERNLVFHVGKFEHSYPFCYRCGTPLYFNALPAWFIDVQALKPSLIKANESIHWFPDHLKHGRFGKGLETAPDWNISRSRYWGTPMPIWEEQLSSSDGTLVVPRRRIIGSLEELKAWAVDPQKAANLTDLHREFLDEIDVWVDDDKTIKGKRVFEVFDCWVESGSMPFAQIHYPFENKEKFEDTYPAQYISEYIAQTRAWFYCMHVLSVGIFGSHAFENCLTTGTLQAEDGQKMSKSKKNYPDPELLIAKYGSDCLRLYLMSSPLMRAENMNFSDKNVHEIQNKVINMLWNIYGFYSMYVGKKVAKFQPEKKENDHPLDRWLLSKMADLVNDVTTDMDAYDVAGAARRLITFTSEFSTWFVRLSRDRIKTSERTQELFGWSLQTFVQLLAPFTPFITERIYQGITASGSSIHLTNWPTSSGLESFVDADIETDMSTIAAVMERAHAMRKEKQLKVRQPLASVSVQSPSTKPSEEILSVLLDEINVEAVEWKRQEGDFVVSLDTNLTPDLIAKGQMREAIRSIQDMRKAMAGLGVNDHIDAWLPQWPEAYTQQIQEKTLARSLQQGEAKIEKIS